MIATQTIREATERIMAMSQAELDAMYREIWVSYTQYVDRKQRIRDRRALRRHIRRLATVDVAVTVVL